MMKNYALYEILETDHEDKSSPIFASLQVESK